MVMEHQKIINSFNNTPNQPTKFGTKTWIKTNDELRGTYNTNSQSKCKTSMLRSILCDYSGAYINVSGTSTVTEAGADDAEKLYFNWKYIITLGIRLKRT